MRARDVFCLVFEGSPRLAVAREEEHTDAVLTSFRERDVGFRARGAEKGVRELEENARAVTRGRVASDRAPVLEVLEEPQSVAHDVVRARASQMRDEPHAAPVVFMDGVIQPLRWRRSRGTS